MENQQLSTGPPIMRLAAELLGAIAEQVPKEDLPSLRLTSRAMSAAAADSFRDAFFTERAHLITEHSLKALSSIAQDPFLRSKLKKLTFSIPGLDRRFSQGLSQRNSWPKNEYIIQTFFKLVYSARGVDPEPMSLVKTLSPDEQARREQMDLAFCRDVRETWEGMRDITKKKCTNLLTVVLGHLARSRIFPALEAGDFQIQSMPAYGRGDLERLLGVKEWMGHISMSMLLDPDVVFSALLEAIRRTGFKVESLLLPGGRYHDIHRSQGFTFVVANDCIAKKVRESFSGLKSLTLNGDYTETNEILPPLWHTEFQHVVDAASATLTELNIHFELDSEVDLSQIRTMFSCCSLRKLQLRGANLSSEGLIELLSSQREITDINLNKVYLHFEDEQLTRWAAIALVCAWAAENMEHLEKVRASLWQGDWGGEHEVHGKGEIQSWLRLTAYNKPGFQG